MFVDASAIVSIATNEPDADELADTLDQADEATTSAIAVFEATLGVRRKLNIAVSNAHDSVLELLELSHVRIVPITTEMARIALEAFTRFGKGQGHPAQLNMGDCFSYAGAKATGAALLFKGNDFPQTDIRPALVR